MENLKNFFSENYELISEMMKFDFMIRAMVVGLFVSVCAALLGVSLVLKRYAMIGTGLSHVGFAAMVIAGVIDIAPLALSIPVVIVAAFLLLRLNESNKINGDSAVALVSTSGLAIGVIIMGLTTGITLHICNVLFGSILAISRTDMQLGIILCAVVIILFVLFYKQLFAVTFDENFAKATGTNVEIYKSLLALLTAVTVVLGMRMMGALLITSLTLFPALSAMRVCKRFLSVVIASATIGVICFFIGIILSIPFNLPPGASIVGVNLILFIILNFIYLLKRRFA
jgi:zinc transport system permease protein